MLTKDQVLEKIKAVLFIEKHHRKSSDFPLPEYYPGYNKVVLIAKKLKPHYDFFEKPVELLKIKAPNMQKAEEDYILSNYRPITPPYWGKAENSIGRIWNPDNFSVSFKETDENLPSNLKSELSEEYFKEEYPKYKSIYNYFANVVTKWKVRDANAVLSFKPRKIPRLDSGLVDTSVAIEPVAVVHNSKNVIHNDDDFAIIELAEKSFVLVGNGTKKEGRILEVYDDQIIWRVTQTGRKLENTFSVDIYWKHELGYVPVRKLGGIPEQDGDIEFDKSHFCFALPNLDDAVVNNSTLQISILTQAFPHLWMITNPCTETGCVDGQIKNRETGTFDTCKTCSGSGKRPTPAGIFEIQMPTGKFDKGAPAPPTPPFGFEAPDPSILKFLNEYLRDKIIEGFEFMGINVSNSTTKTSKDMTATQRFLDNEDFFSFLTLMSTELFDLLSFSFKSIGRMRYGKDYQSPEVKKPVNFILRTFKELTDEIGIAREKGIPAIAITKLLEEYSETRFHTSDKFLRTMQIVIAIDPLIVKTDSEIIMDLNRNIITIEQAVLHVNILQFIEEGVRDKDFKLMDKIAVIKESLLKKTQERIPAQASVKTTNDLLKLSTGEN